MKNLHRVKLVGVTADGSVAKYGSDVVAFKGRIQKPDLPKWEVFVKKLSADKVQVNTPKGAYTLPLSRAGNFFQGVCNDVKVHISLKKVVGELRAWY